MRQTECGFCEKGIKWVTSYRMSGGKPVRRPYKCPHCDGTGIAPTKDAK